MEAVGRLAGGIAHDFNNMLGVILGHTEMALEELGPLEPIHADLEEIRVAGLRSSELTRQLLAFARKQAIAASTRPPAPPRGLPGGRVHPALGERRRSAASEVSSLHEDTSDIGRNVTRTPRPGAA